MTSSPKDRVRANIYKTLLEEEKRKKKKRSVLSVSLFVIGIFTGKTINTVMNLKEYNFNQKLALEMSHYSKSTNLQNKLELEMINDLFEVDKIKLQKDDFDFENLFVSEVQI